LTNSFSPFYLYFLLFLLLLLLPKKTNAKKIHPILIFTHKNELQLTKYKKNKELQLNKKEIEKCFQNIKENHLTFSNQRNIAKNTAAFQRF